MLIVGSTSLNASVSSEIESLRGKMVSLGLRYGLRHPEVQQCSEKLDELLLEYYFSEQVMQQIKEA